jgi:tetratricopeptide (TPR) repeat protein
MENEADYLFEKSQEQFQAGNTEQGFIYLDKAIRNAPDHTEYLLVLGNMKRKYQDNLGAIEAYTEVIRLSSDIDELQEAYSWRAITYEILGRYSEMIADITWSIDKGLAISTTYAWRGFHYFKMGHYQEAISDFTNAYQKDPQNLDNLQVRAAAYYELQKYEAVIQDLDQMLSVLDQHSSARRAAYHLRGKALFRLGKHVEALADFNKILEIDGVAPISNPLEYLESYAPNKGQS